MPLTRLAVLVHRSSGQPLQDTWQPSLRPGELEAANERLTHLPYTWRWVEPVAEPTP